MSFVDLSEYDKPTTHASERGIELVDNVNGQRKTVHDFGVETEKLLVDFLRGRIRLDEVPGRVTLEEDVVAQDLKELGVVPKVREAGIRIIRMVKELV